MNKILLCGRLCADPEAKDVGEKSLAELRLAVNRRFKKDEADFFSVNVWGPTADYCTNYLSKGSQVNIVGRCEIQSWESDGERKYKTVVIAEEVYGIGGRSDNNNNNDNENKETKKTETKKQGKNVKKDDLPF